VAGLLRFFAKGTTLLAVSWMSLLAFCPAGTLLPGSTHPENWDVLFSFNVLSE